MTGQAFGVVERSGWLLSYYERDVCCRITSEMFVVVLRARWLLVVDTTTSKNTIDTQPPSSIYF
jgi:hypothetical protein